MIKEIQNSFHDFIAWLSDGAAAFLNSAISSIKASGGKVLTDAATAAVAAAEANGGSGSDKFKAAYESVIGVLTAEGIVIVENAVRIAIEAAVANLKNA